MSQIIIDEMDDYTVMQLKGQFIGGDETDSLRDSLKQISEKDKNILIIDLEKTTYLNSTALGVFISARANFSKRNGKLLMANLNKSIENIFEITKLNLIFSIFQNLEDAKNSI